MQDMVDNVKVHEDIINYIVSISNATRVYEDLRLGASPRASIDLLKAAKAKAFISGRNYVIPDDVKTMVLHVLGHRLILSTEARIGKRGIDEILKGVLNRVFIPVIINE